MRLFDLKPYEAGEVKRFLAWHLGYVALIAAFFALIYYFGLFKSHYLLKESPLFTYVAPLSTAAFTALSPWRGAWRRAIRDTWARLGEPAFRLMGAFVFITGFFFYSVFLWGLGALGPSIVYM